MTHTHRWRYERFDPLTPWQRKKHRWSEARIYDEPRRGGRLIWRCFMDVGTTVFPPYEAQMFVTRYIQRKRYWRKAT